MVPSPPVSSQANRSPETSDDLRARLADAEQKIAVLEAERAQRHHLEEVLKRREAEFTDFVENAAEGLHQVAGDGTIIWPIVPSLSY